MNFVLNKLIKSILHLDSTFKETIEQLKKESVKINESIKKLIEEKGFIREKLQNDLDRIGEAGIARDIIFEQGPEVLGL